jgi:hypothetical protein
MIAKGPSGNASSLLGKVLPDLSGLSVGQVLIGNASGDLALGTSGKLVQRVRVPMSAFLDIDGHTPLPSDNTIPQISEGALIVSTPITPKGVGNKIAVRGSVQWDGLNYSGIYTAALFEAGNTNAIAATGRVRGPSNLKHSTVEGEFTTVSLVALTFSLRFGHDGGIGNGDPTVNGPTPGIYGGVAATWIELLEYTP